MPCSRYCGRNGPESSRERPSVGWVKSFVPNEENSATAPISPVLREPQNVDEKADGALGSSLPLSCLTKFLKKYLPLHWERFWAPPCPPPPPIRGGSPPARPRSGPRRRTCARFATSRSL